MNAEDRHFRETLTPTMNELQRLARASSNPAHFWACCVASVLGNAGNHLGQRMALNILRDVHGQLAPILEAVVNKETH